MLQYKVRKQTESWPIQVFRNKKHARTVYVCVFRLWPRIIIVFSLMKKKIKNKLTNLKPSVNHAIEVFVLFCFGSFFSLLFLFSFSFLNQICFGLEKQVKSEFLHYHKKLPNFHKKRNCVSFGRMIFKTFFIIILMGIHLASINNSVSVQKSSLAVYKELTTGVLIKSWIFHSQEKFFVVKYLFQLLTWKL